MTQLLGGFNGWHQGEKEREEKEGREEREE